MMASAFCPHQLAPCLAMECVSFACIDHVEVDDVVGLLQFSCRIPVRLAECESREFQGKCARRVIEQVDYQTDRRWA